MAQVFQEDTSLIINDICPMNTCKSNYQAIKLLGILLFSIYFCIILSKGFSDEKKAISIVICGFLNSDEQNRSRKESPFHSIARLQYLATI